MCMMLHSIFLAWFDFFAILRLYFLESSRLAKFYFWLKGCLQVVYQFVLLFPLVVFIAFIFLATISGITINYPK